MREKKPLFVVTLHVEGRPTLKFDINKLGGVIPSVGDVIEFDGIWGRDLIDDGGLPRTVCDITRRYISNRDGVYFVHLTGDVREATEHEVLSYFGV